ncbi:M23 family metallopeptidase [Oerskovia sp. NPDC057915]|uniref:M23 family metallopeptidase n=1 Tax=Oerskovia sp. NPDC057915 TaxID=3346280 RepID=UPI0036D8EC64
MRLNPVTGVTKLHAGTDIGAPSGASIWAASAGTVIFSAFDSGGGNMVKIAHGGGVETWYLHMTARHVAVGAAVAAGQQIGTVGSTGNSTGPHLHFETRVNGAPQNPAPFMSARGVALGIGTPPTNPTPNPTPEDELTPTQAAQLAQTVEHTGEIRRMLGVLLGYNAPANETELTGLTQLWGQGKDTTEARRMLGVILGWTAPAAANETEALAKLWGQPTA